MNTKVRFREKILSELKEIRDNKNGVVLFGAADIGRMAKKALETMNIEVKCYCDNDSAKQAQLLDEIEVLSVENLMKRYKNSSIIVCTLSDYNQVMITKKMKSNGFESVYSVYSLLFHYKVSIISHDSDQVLNLLYNIKYSSESLIISAINIPITEKCTLRCEKCSSLTPYIESHKHFDKKTILNSSTRFFNVVDGVKRVVISGGEPLLYPNLIEMCDKLNKFQNILTIRVITNGTVIPNKLILKKFRDYGISLTISDYGKISNNKIELIKLCEEIGVSWDRNVYNYNTWIDFGDFNLCRNRGDENNLLVFKKCWDWVKATYLMNGEYYLCHRSAYIAHLDEVRKNEKEYVDILNFDLTDVELRKQIKRLTFETRILSACDYCNTRLNEHVKPGEQSVGIYKLNKIEDEREKKE